MDFAVCGNPSLGLKRLSKADIDRPSKYIPDADSPTDCKTTDALRIGIARNAIWT
jgi:hypothetical protein